MDVSPQTEIGGPGAIKLFKVPSRNYINDGINKCNVAIHRDPLSIGSELPHLPHPL